jgi:lysophospholipase L1-like esterase
MDHRVARHGRIRATAIALTAALLGTGGLAAGARAAARPGPVPVHHPVPVRITPQTPVTPGSGYLALGDSVSFGYMEPTVVPAPDFADAASFRGFPEVLGSDLHLKVANAACPGETSSSLLDAGAQSLACETVAAGASGPAYRQAYPLHVRYSGSQMAYANRYLTSHPGTRLVSLMIGANDAFLCQDTTTDGCTSELGGVLATITRNVHTILSTIRHRDHYNGQIVIVDYYSLDYGSALASGESRALNSAMAAGAKGMHVRVADAYSAFARAALHSGDNTCTAGLLTQLGAPGTCGVHPSVAGQTLLASTIAGAIKLG